jgi:SAM-dependent methyltransferase
VHPPGTPIHSDKTPPVSASAGRARRACLRCGESDGIPDESPLWPAGWRCPTCGFGHATKNGFVQLAPDLDDVNEGFDLASYDGLSAIEDDHFWFKTRNEMISWLVQRVAAQVGHALEIGCGTGYLLLALREALPSARSRAARDSGLCDALDLVGAFDVLEHILDDRRVLDEIHRMLRPGGVLIATVPQHLWLWSAADEVAHHQRRYKVGELANKARNAGFNIQYQTSFAALTLSVLAASRLRSRLSKRGDSTESLDIETNVPRRLNAALKYVFRGEHVLRRLGLPLPLGGSQVIVRQSRTPSPPRTDCCK